MAVAFRSASTDFPSADTDTLLQPTLPAGTVAGDILVAIGGCLASRTITPPSGFTQRLTNANTSNAAWLWTKTAVGSDNLDFTLSATFSSGGVAVLCYSGGTETGLVSGTATISSNDNSPACPSVTTTAANSMVVSAECTGGSMTAVQAATSERVDANGGAAGNSLAAYDEIKAAAGATTARTITTSGFGRWNAFTLAIAPSSGGGDTTAPVVASASVNAAGTTLTIAFTEAGSPPVLPASSVTGFTLTASGGAVTLSSTAISSTTFTATTSRTINSGETLTLAYTPGNVTDSAATPNSLATFSGTSVTNNSTQVVALAAGTASFVSSGTGGISVSATDATGGTPSYTYQWQRNASGGSYSNLSGATSRTLTDATATAGTLYGYKLAYTDAASATATSNAVTAQVYTGGSLASGLARIIGG